MRLHPASRRAREAGTQGRLRVSSREDDAQVSRRVVSSPTSEDEAERLCQVGVGVGDELDELGAGEAHVLLPRRHHRAVVHAHDVHHVDAGLLKAAVDLGSLEARHLARGSGGRERARQRDLSTAKRRIPFVSSRTRARARFGVHK